MHMEGKTMSIRVSRIIDNMKWIDAYKLSLHSLFTLKANVHFGNCYVFNSHRGAKPYRLTSGLPGQTFGNTSMVSFWELFLIVNIFRAICSSWYRTNQLHEKWVD